MSQIDLMLDEENELTFQLNIEGTRPADASCRLLVDAGHMSMVFEATKEPSGEISVILPPLKNVIKEGVYDLNLEVIVDDKYFRPLSLKGNFEKSLTVTAEAVVKRKPRKTKPSVSLVEVNKSSKRRAPTVTTRATKKKVRENKEISDQEIMDIIKKLAR